MSTQPLITNTGLLFHQTPNVLISTLILFSLLFAVKANAACQREDVSFYLKKGFTHEQIVKLCDHSSVEQSKVAPITQQKNISDQPQQSTSYGSAPTPSPHTEQTSFGLYNHPDAVFLATAIEGYDVEVTDHAIVFARKDCFDYGLEDFNGFRNRACPNVRYSISRGGLRVVERDNGLFGFGSTILYVSGNVSADIIDLDVFKAEDREKIQSMVEAKTHKLKINVRSGMPQSKVEAILMKLAS